MRAKVLLAIVCPNAQCSLDFSLSLLRLQMALVKAPLDIQVDVVPSLCKAIEVVNSDESYTNLVCIASHVSFTAAFVLRGLSSGHPFVAGIYPLTVLDWDRVKEAAVSSESPQYRGNVYNLDIEKASFGAQGYLSVSDGSIEPGAVILTREAVEAIASLQPKTDADVTTAWGKTIHADLDQQCANFGQVEFVGCAGSRAILR